MNYKRVGDQINEELLKEGQSSFQTSFQSCIRFFQVLQKYYGECYDLFAKHDEWEDGQELSPDTNRAMIDFEQSLQRTVGLAAKLKDALKRNE